MRPHTPPTASPVSNAVPSARACQSPCRCSRLLFAFVSAPLRVTLVACLRSCHHAACSPSRQTPSFVLFLLPTHHTHNQAFFCRFTLPTPSDNTSPRKHGPNRHTHTHTRRPYAMPPHISLSLAIHHYTPRHDPYMMTPAYHYYYLSPCTLSPCFSN